MTKADLAKKVAEKNGTTQKDAAAAVDAVFDCIKEALKENEKVQIFGFGGFEVKTRAARKGINPRTKEAIEIPEAKNVKFSAGKALNELVK